MEAESLERRCPRLGGPVKFSYCRMGGEEGGDCFKVLDCWWEIFDVSAYLRARLSPEEFQRLHAARPKPKVVSLLELIQQAQQRVAQGDKSGRST